jgi:hypothetical protein
MLKGYGLKAGGLALLSAITALVAVLLLPALELLQATFPVMTLLGPLIVVQYLFWRRHSGVERTTYQYLQAERRLTQASQSQRNVTPGVREKVI